MTIADFKGKAVHMKTNEQTNKHASNMKDRSCHYYGIYSGHDETFMYLKIEKKTVCFPISNVVFVEEV
ncbi:hypothetical protein ABNB59_18935 [Paenibacillus larvae]|uniref:Uncharacterized protein n=4 Tax=Paenibacillus larvae TaxID=1464 RepID=V9W7A9_9BACL|nr:hypothetical protein [Paenibacillus larvae]AHD06033.1 hypothetical protein ERIC2_c22410 [Paenibacillus larvae subsp. larvae DSM 25430]AQR76469.1 hypothetical protein BXP28_02855 [Paenibacillus larvae subsp. larvae]AQT83704.1 hypothetical protein B1222_03625 [Paenibacillus larvae subsp. pulvifaciens]AQZ48852.1 hypothetical protein B5S25_21970 [Paenibacillus larvae subsp. pulvifaciens]ARF69857.1 hypothetical protein B7C51_21475 [Paenibacillus larvae subsp. pulvifaciens]